MFKKKVEREVLVEIVRKILVDDFVDELID